MATATADPPPAPLSARLRWTFAAAFVGMWGPLTVFGSHRTTLFVIWYQTPVLSLSAVGIVMGFVDAFNGPLVATMADRGALNRWLPCFPMRTWGRRAPIMLLGTPLMVAGPTLMWLAPSRAAGALVAWYALCYFLSVNGVTLTLQSYLASIQELFASGDERARAIYRQTPFMVLTCTPTPLRTPPPWPRAAELTPPAMPSSCLRALSPTAAPLPACSPWLGRPS